MKKFIVLALLLLLVILFSSPIKAAFSIINLRGSASPIILHPETYDSVPSAMKDGSTYKLWWASGYNGGDTMTYAEASSIGGPWHAPGSTTPNTFVYGLVPSKQNFTFDGLHTADHSIIKVNGIYYAYYGGGPIINTSLHTTMIGVAKSTDGVHWTRLNGGNPIVKPAFATFLNSERNNSSGGDISIMRLIKGDLFYMTMDISDAKTKISQGYSPMPNNYLSGAISSKEKAPLEFVGWHRLYKLATDSNIYTYDTTRIQSEKTNGYVDMGIVGYILPNDPTLLKILPTFGVTPIYEGYNAVQNKYMYTISTAEMAIYKTKGWTFPNHLVNGQLIEGLVGYVYKAAPYGAGQPTVTYVNGKFYMLYTDTTGKAASVTDGLGSQYLIRSADPTFQSGVERYDGSGFTTATLGDYTQNKLIKSVSVDLMYADSIQSFLVIESLNRTNKKLYQFDNNFNLITTYSIPDQPLPTGFWYQDGVGLFTTPDRHALTGSNGNILVDFVGAVGSNITSNVTTAPAKYWELYWRGADLTNGTITADTKSGDINGDGLVNIIDIGIIIDNYGKSILTNPKSDLNTDGTANIIDIGIVIDGYGK